MSYEDQEEIGKFDLEQVEEKVQTVQVKEGSRVLICCRRVLAYSCIIFVLAGTAVGVWSQLRTNALLKKEILS